MPKMFKNWFMHQAHKS